ncbi:microtubule-actin cross-linking factor 1, isoforms 1/2/3/5-like [Anabas testudineus]|uniref:microtubule-actin cross-linking factor 1, isoforms 1/2/3/5-like n=1 Tax=Anabas testudineus TaxID=64144 RepID=UPI000E45A164|nr:microtubule-actin cross-linking factor 1, isoforms 1/2/3/5-like [Anabas testudineus]
MESSDDDTLSERSCVSEPSFRSERSGGSLSPCPSGPVGPPGDTLPWNLSKHERRKRKSQDSVLDPAERAVVRVADERDRVQKKTFTKWVNKHLIKVRKHITDLYEDLRDGHNLISLLEVLSGVTLPREKGRMRFHRLQNIQIALDFLKQRQVKLVNIRNDDITDGNPKLTLGLIWTIILHFQISEIYVSGESGDLTAKEKLLLWSQQATEGYPGLRCVNFTSSWSDGRMFNALLHRYRPDLIDMEVVSRQSNRENLEQAFEIAESLGVTRLLDAEDVDVPSPDEKSVITYVSSIYDAFPKIPEGGEGIAAHEVDPRWSEYQSRFSSLLQWSRQHTGLMANKNFPQNPVELKALYNEYVHFKETEIPVKEIEKGHIAHLYKLLEVWIEFGRIKLPQGLHPNDLEEEWGKLILEMLEREKALRPAVERLEVLLQRANKIQNMALDCEEKLTLAKNTLQADMSRIESGDAVQCEKELACYLQDCEALIRQLNLELKVLKDEKYYQVEQLVFRVSCLQEELVSLRLQCSSVYRKGHFSQALGSTGAELTSQRGNDSGLSLGQTLLGAVGAVGAVGAALLRRPMARSQLVAMSSSEDEGSLRFIYELLGWVEETQELLERAEWGADLPSVENNLQEHNKIHTAVEELMSGLQEARSYEAKVSANFKSSYSETLAKLEHQYCKLLEHSSWRLRSLESLHTFLSQCTEELIWLNEREEEEVSYDWSDNNTNMNAKRELYSEMRLELDEKRDVMRSLQETASRLCQENHPAKQTLEAYSAALQNQWQWVDQLCVCVEQHLKDNTTYFQFMGDARDCESYLRQLQETIKRQYTCDKNSRLSKLEDLLQDSMEEKEQLIEYRSTVASLVGRAKTVVQLRPRSAETTLSTTTPIKAICDYKQIEITISRGEECVLEDNSQRSKWKVISPTGNEAMVPSVCFTIPPPNQEAIDTASRAEQLYQKVMSLWHQLHVNMKSVVSWHYLLKDIRTVSEWNLDTVRCQSPSGRQQILDHLESQLSDFLSDSKESSLFTPAERRDLEKDVQQALQHCQDLLVNMETVEKDESVSRSYLSELQNITLSLNEAEQRLMRGIQAPPPSRLWGDSVDNVVQIADQEKLQSEIDALRSSLGDFSRRCVSFFEEKSTSSSVPVLRSELNQAVEKLDKLHNLSSVYLEKLKTVDILIHSLDEAESQVRKYESRLSEEDIVPPDTAAIKNLREQLQKWQSELTEHEGIFQSLQSEVLHAKEAGSQLSKLHPDRSPELELYEDRANQMTERWSGVKRQMETRETDLEALGSALQQYRDGHSALVEWIEETTQRQENAQPGQTDSKALSEQLAQQTALVAEIEQNQTKLDDCQTHAKQYCNSVKDYELQLMTYRAFVESTHKSPVKRRRMHSSSEAVTQEFMDLRTRYTALVTLTTQHVKYISDSLRRLEEEEKEVEEEKQARVSQVSDLLGWVKGLQGRTGGPNAESSLAAQQAITEQLAAKKDDVAEAIRSTQVFLLSKQASKLSPEERAHVEAQLDELTATYNELCDSSTQQLQQLEQQLAKEEERKDPVVSLEAQLIMGGLVQPDSRLSFTLEQGLAQDLIDTQTRQSLSELENALLLVENTKSVGDQQQNVLPVAMAMEMGLFKEEVGLRILELHINTGGLRDSTGKMISLEQAEDMKLLTPRVITKLRARLQHKELIDPNTAEKLNLYELQQRCVLNEDSGLLLFPVKQQPGGTVCLCSGRKVGIFRAVQEGLIDRKVTVRLLEAQLFAGGITDPRSGHRLTIDEAVRHGLMDQDLACAMLARQLQNGGILDPVSGERLDLEESIRRDLLSPRLALSVLESLWTFMGLLWPESGELLPIAEALQQGIISGELARNILTHRHAIGALYNPETLRCCHLTRLLLLYTPIFSTSSSCPTGLVFESTPPTDGIDPEEQARQKLLFHLMTHSYVDVHSGKRLVLLNSELMELVKAAELVVGDSNGSQVHIDESTVEKEGEDVHLARLVLELKQGGLMSEDGEKLLPDEAVAQGVLPGHTAVKLMAQAGLFGGFLDAGSGESLSMEDVMQEGLLDEDLMWSVLKSDKTLAGVVDFEKRQIYGVKEAAQAGLIDSNTAARLMEAQVASGGIVDLHRDKKVSVTLAANLGLIDEDQQEELVALEKAYKGKVTDLGTSLKKANLQLQMEGVIDPESKSPVPLDQAIQKGLIRSEEAYQVLAKQVAEGGIIHHASGMRLSVSDAIDRGLVDRSIAPGLEELEWVFQGKISSSSHPEAVILQASTGAILDPDTRRKLTLSEAVSKGLLDGNIASEAMASPTVTQGALDPQTARIVPYSELVRQGKIDIETGKRFLEVKPFKGIKNEQTEEILTLSEAVASKQVDPVPALRLLQSQANSGGIIDINDGERLSLSEAHNRGLVGDDVAKIIATNQISKGLEITEQQVSSLSDATRVGLISRDTASEIQEKVISVEREGDEDSSTPAASSNGTYSPAIILSMSSSDSPAKWSDVNNEKLSPSQFSIDGLGVTQDNGKALTETETKGSILSDQSLFYGTTTVEDNVGVPVLMGEKYLIEPDQSMDLLCNFATKAEKKIQQAIEEIIPQKDTSLSKYEPDETDDNQNQNVFRDSVGESMVKVNDTDEGLKEGNRKGDTVVKFDEEPVRFLREEHSPSDESTLVVEHVPVVENQTDSVAAEIRGSLSS